MTLSFWLWVLLAAALGWVFGRRYDRHKQARRSAERAKRYFKGLSYVLNDQPDKAIDMFVELVNVDPETVDTHFALGNLYRRRGETERAIRIHQNILSRLLLPPAHRSHAQYELGLDYFAAGILDRAEEIFLDLQQDGVYRRSCQKELLALYQQTREWDKAANIADAMRNEGAEDAAPMLAHFYCELAEQALAANRFELTRQRLQTALELDDKSVRASLVAARVAIAEQDDAAFEASLQRMLQQDATLFVEVLALLEIWGKQHAERERQLLNEAIAAGAGASVVLALAERIRASDGDRATGEYLITQLKLRPSLRELLKLVELHVQHAQGSTRESLALLQDVLQRLVAKLPRYRCRRCGFQGKQLHWRCPSCKTWNSVRPVTGIEGE
ncbi:lipopolysaccharide assembly protein LapB [Permianibacter sp. IMCC34836]|uniref:lipopolysaccharide assembly protein LapB n=1 Tax=Permianibacter fluminis TaxID=2738515 RepID=UPI0015575E0B|nr:lipopolysaccharide assembly protein LapB [Permianibacter fluminis]NQD37395.1 lipopolysaccharide assembly protein LapB [Permianibacter fluminis]